MVIFHVNFQDLSGPPMVPWSLPAPRPLNSFCISKAPPVQAARATEVTCFLVTKRMPAET